MTKQFLNAFIAICLLPVLGFAQDKGESMDALWGESVVKLRAEEAERGQLFAEGNYAMFIHWGVYSQLGNKVDGKTYYGIGEWIMNSRMAGIPIDRYKELARTFNPVNFDALKIANLAKDAGMKYIVITAKHHDGFAMFDSKADSFNITEASSMKVDPMKQLAKACQNVGIGFGFYYSHNQDWTYPGGGKGPTTDEAGNPATFDDYFQNKCLPQIRELTTQYGPIEIIWFDTPGSMPKHYIEQLVEIVHKNQPRAMVSGRAGHGLGDYQTLGDMEVPHHNVEGLWEAVDTTNDSWAYAWYDENWKTPREILHRLIACVGRGGTYMLNIGPRGDGTVPERAATSLRQAGEWVKRYPQVVYDTDASPWQHALPWGDVTVKGNKMYLSVFDWPSRGEVYLPGLKSKIQSANVLRGNRSEPIEFTRIGDWTRFKVPVAAPDFPASVIELQLDGNPEVDPTWGLDPEIATEILAEFATVSGATQQRNRWMEKFGEWKVTVEVTNWKTGGKAMWEVDVVEPGDYQVDLTYAGEGRLVWAVSIEGGESIQNQQNASHNYQRFPIGWMHFPKPGRYRVSVSCIDGETQSSSLKSITLKRVPVKP